LAAFRNGRPGQLRTSLLGMSFLNRLERWEVRGNKLMMCGTPSLKKGSRQSAPTPTAEIIRRRSPAFVSTVGAPAPRRSWRTTVDQMKLTDRVG
jgi:hypothetical protein